MARTHMFSRIGLPPAALSALAALPVQGPHPALPRTHDRRPDLQGMWLNSTITPLERPKKFADKEFFSIEEAADFETTYDSPVSITERLGALEERVSGERDYADRGKLLPNRRTSLVVEPRTGRIPYTSGAQQRANARLEAIQRSDVRVPEGPEDLLLRDRCLV